MLMLSEAAVGLSSTNVEALFQLLGQGRSQQAEQSGATRSITITAREIYSILQLPFDTKPTGGLVLVLAHREKKQRAL